LKKLVILYHQQIKRSTMMTVEFSNDASMLFNLMAADLTMNYKYVFR
jgi:hypothetical protein